MHGVTKHAFPIIIINNNIFDLQENYNYTAAAMESCDMIHKSFVGIGGDGHQSMTCATPIEYTGTVCQEELKSLKTCLFGDSDRESAHPLIITENNLEIAKIVLSSDLVSPVCAAEVKPFLCLHLFGLCSATGGVSYQPTACHCRNLRDNICADEWRLVEMIQHILSNFPVLPNCDTKFSDNNKPCYTDNGSGELGNMWFPILHACMHARTVKITVT